MCIPGAATTQTKPEFKGKFRARGGGRGVNPLFFSVFVWGKKMGLAPAPPSLAPFTNENWFASAAQESADRNHSADRHHVLSARLVHAGQLEYDAARVREGDLAHGGNSQA